MTPVDARYTRSTSTPRARATVCAVSVALTVPAAPVNALALPELHTSALAVRFPSLKMRRHHSTGADGHFEEVNVAATVVPSASEARNRSSPAWELIPAA